MQRRRIRALVLAAGLGTRLRPLTRLVPKPLLPVHGEPILGHTLARLATAGCEAAAVNLHHLGDAIRQRFGGSYQGMPLTWSEEPEILGTLGALYPLKDFLASADLVLLVNGDSLCDWPFHELIERHLANGARSTLLLTSRPDPARFGGGVGIDRDGRILSFRQGDPERGEVEDRYVFAGAHVFPPDLLSGLKPGFSDIVRDLYKPMLAAGEAIGSLVDGGPWHDMGTPQRFLEGTLEGRSSWTSPQASVAAAAEVRRSSIEPGATVEAGARIEGSVLLPGARIGAGSVVRESIVGFDAIVPPGARIERRIVTAPSVETPFDGDSDGKSEG
jgi:mannose-1-phosphate guanylyltransferase